MMLRSSLAAAALLCALAAQAVDTAAKPTNNELAAKYNVQLGIAYLKQGEVALAQNRIEKALRENPGDSSVQIAAGLLYESLGDMDESGRHYAQALHIEPKNPDMLNTYGAFLCRRGQGDKGEKLLAQSAKSPLNANPEVAYTNAGTCALAAGRLDQAEQYFKTALQVRETYPDALLQLAGLAFKRNNLIQARGYLSKFIANATSTPDSLLLGIRIERAAGDYDAAGEYAQQLRRDYPESQQARQLRDGAIK
jgi:type IV pilus assembly protein PilF